MTEKEKYYLALMNVSRTTGTMNCDKKCMCDECDKQCDVHLKYKEDCLLIENLIKEHFDNPPLKFEQIEDLDILWHNKREEYIKVTSKFINKIGKETICFVYFGSDYEDYDYFEEGMFYRKEVEDE